MLVVDKTKFKKVNQFLFEHFLFTFHWLQLALKCLFNTWFKQDDIFLFALNEF